MDAEVQHEKCGGRNKVERELGNKAEEPSRRIGLKRDLRQNLKGLA